MKQRRSKPSPNDIPGVYNYCDAWCERCYFTTRCLNYRMRKEMEQSDNETDDVDEVGNEKFWKELEENLTDTVDMLHEAANEMDFDFEITDEEMEEFRKEREKIHDDAEATWIARTSRMYADRLRDWSKKNEKLFDEKKNVLAQHLQLDLNDDKKIGEAFAINDAMEVVMWYHFFIYVKLMRALQGKMGDDEDEFDDIPKDSDGSAKIALISMDRSIAALGVIYKHIPEQGDEILNFLMTLEKLRNATEAEFPDARKFIRAGFDEG